MSYFCVISSPLGKLLLGAEGDALTFVQYQERGNPEYKIKPDKTFSKLEIADLKKCPVLSQTKKQLEEYFHGKRSSFDLNLNPKGTDFRKTVWEAMDKIPYGTTVTYGELGELMGKKSQSGEQWHVARAIGSGASRNPILIVVPCHRVVAKGGKISGYSGGVETKGWLLEHEKKHSPNLKIQKPQVAIPAKVAKDQKDSVKTLHGNLPVCEYGSSCYRTNPQHLKQFYHPPVNGKEEEKEEEEEEEEKKEDKEIDDEGTQEIDDEGTQEMDDEGIQKVDPKVTKKKVCVYGVHCYRSNPQHLADYIHLSDSKSPKKQKTN